MKILRLTFLSLDFLTVIFLPHCVLSFYLSSQRSSQVFSLYIDVLLFSAFISNLKSALIFFNFPVICLHFSHLHCIISFLLSKVFCFYTIAARILFILSRMLHDFFFNSGFYRTLFPEISHFSESSESFFSLVAFFFNKLNCLYILEREEYSPYLEFSLSVEVDCPCSLLFMYFPSVVGG